jgi:sugar lactone lactonase YvrE
MTGLLSCMSEQSKVPVTSSELFMILPDICPTPDGMALDKYGNIILACPNYADMSKPAVFMKIDTGRNISLYATCPVLDKTGRACPMGIDFGPDGGLYVCDNQGWPGTPEGRNEGRLLKLTIEDGNIVKTEIIAYGMSHPNGVKYRNGKIYVTQSMLPKIESEQMVSAIYRFDESDRDILINNDSTDNQLMIQFKTYNKDVQYGMDGLVFDSKGNLFSGNFGDGTVHKIIFDPEANVRSSSVFAKSDQMRSTDGLCIDHDDNIYVADFSANAICEVTPEGKVIKLAQSPDNDGAHGGLDQPGEPLIWNGNLIVSNFDLVTGPDKVNTRHDKPYTLSLIKLKD